MTYVNENLDLLVLTWAYLFLYNASLLLLLFTLFQYIGGSTRTLFSFSDLGAANFYTKVLIVLLLSMAGVPPFWGFFSKLFIFLAILNTSLSVLFLPLLILLIISLYFYVQNVRFLNATAPGKFVPITLGQMRVVTAYGWLATSLIFLLLVGGFVTEDLLLFISWLLY